MDPNRNKHHWSSNKHSAKIHFGLPSICFEVIVILLHFRVRVLLRRQDEWKYPQFNFTSQNLSLVFVFPLLAFISIEFGKKYFYKLYSIWTSPTKNHGNLKRREKDHCTYFSTILLAPLSKNKICTFTTSLNQKVLLHLYNT